MKYIFLLTFSLLVLTAHGQDTDSVVVSPAFEDPFGTDNTIEDITEDDDNYDDEDTTTHTTVDPNTLTGPYKSEKLTVRKFDREKWKKVVGDTNYLEEEPVQKQAEESDDSSWSTVAPIIQYISYGLAIALIGLLIYFIVKNIKVGYTIENKEKKAVDYNAQIENIEDIDIQNLLQKALAEKNYKLAVRLYFLGLLKTLNKNEIIAWKKDKTNRDYLTELFSKNFHFEKMQQLTLAYEQVWYGDHALSNDSYQKLFAEFESIDQQLKTEKPL